MTKYTFKTIGEIEEYLEKAYKFLTAAKMVSNPDSPDVPDFGRVAGGTKPTEQAANGDLNSTYSTTIF